MRIKDSLRNGLRRLPPSGLLALLLLTATALRLFSENVTLTTSYPSPAGIYRQLITTGRTVLARDGGGVTMPWSEYFPFTIGAGLGFAAPTWPEPSGNVPAPGRMFYNRDKDQFYYTSKNAQSGNSATWYKAMSGLEEAQIISGSNTGTYTPPNNNLQYAPWGGASPGSVVCTGGTCLRSDIQNVAGLYVIELSGNYCAPAPRSGGTTGDPDTASPRFMIYWRRCSTSSCSGWAAASDLNGDFDVDPGTGCAEFSTQSMVMSTVNRRIDVRFRVQRDSPSGNVATPDNVNNYRMTVTRVLGF